MKECMNCWKKILDSSKECKYCGEKQVNWKKWNKEDQVKNSDIDLEVISKMFGMPSFDDILQETMKKKDQETNLWAVLKWFDYIWWIFVIRWIVIVFKWYSITPSWFRFLMWCYLIFWVYTVIKSIINNVKVAKNTNKIFRAIIKAKKMVKEDEDKNKIIEELDIRNIIK